MELNFIDLRKQESDWKIVNTKNPWKYLERVFGKNFEIIGLSTAYEKYVRDLAYDQYLQIVDKSRWVVGKIYINDETLEFLNDTSDTWNEYTDE